MSIDYLALPNLPGFKSHGVVKTSKKQCFTFVNGQIFLKDDALPALSVAEEGSVQSIGQSQSTALRSLKSRSGVENVNVTLTFQAYFEEVTLRGEIEDRQVRKVNIYFFVENGTIAIVERPQMNSGIPQGTLVRRSIVHKADGTPFQAEDLRLGEDIVIYGRRYKLVDCDHATRKYFRRYLQVSESAALSVPTDDYAEFRKTLEPSHDTAWGKFHSRKNDGKRYQEARMGNNPDSNKGREGFIRYGEKTLQFLCVWDNTMTMYGDRVEFSLVYHLCDDTIEIFSCPSANSGKDQFSRLLKRSKLPKLFGGLRGLQDGSDEPAYYHWTDIFIGMELDVYARRLRVMDSDNRCVKKGKGRF